MLLKHIDSWFNHSKFHGPELIKIKTKTKKINKVLLSRLKTQAHTYG
jgi:hypothetical protein